MEFEQQQSVGRREDVELYVRTYSTVLRSSGEVHLRAFERAHINVCPSLHAGAGSPVPDAGALIYAVNRLPLGIGAVERVVLGQLPEHFAQALGSSLDEWAEVQAPARRRQWHYDGRSTLAVHVASSSDIDDVIPTLVAYQIEWNKLHHLVRADAAARALVEAAPHVDRAVEERVRRRILADAARDCRHRKGSRRAVVGRHRRRVREAHATLVATDPPRACRAQSRGAADLFRVVESA